MNWEDLIEEFLIDLEVKGRAETTIKNYKSKLTHYSKFFKAQNIMPLEIKKGDINKYVLSLVEQKQQNSSINIAISRIKKLFDYVVEEKMLDENPIVYTQRPAQKKVIKILNEKQINLLLQEVQRVAPYPIINQRNLVIFMMLIDCGMRIIEIQNLNESDILKNQIIIRNSKFNKDRVVALSPILRREIIKYRRMKDKYYQNKDYDREAFFISYQLCRLQAKAIWPIMKAVKDKCDIDDDIRFSPHTLRHTYAYMQIKNGLDIHTLSINMGHYSVAMTERYLTTLTSDSFLEKSLKASNLMNLNKKRRGR